MRCENKDSVMRANRFLSHPAVIPILLVFYNAFFFFLITYIINVMRNIKYIIRDNENFEKYFGLYNFIPRIAGSSKEIILLYVLLFIFLIVTSIGFVYKIRASFGADEMNKGQYGNRRWTTISEIKRQFKKVPMVKEEYDGDCGTLISRIGNSFYIDTSPTNLMALGTTRSGKGEAFVFPSIDVYSRAKNKPSLILNDQKLELYASSKKTLEERGYIVRLLNLDEPQYSCGYNPLSFVLTYYKKGQIEKAQMMARSFAYSIFHAEDSNQEPIWKNTATSLFTALIIAVTSDCVELDKKLNKERKNKYDAYLKKFTEQEESIKQEMKRKVNEYLLEKPDADFEEVGKQFRFITEDIPFQESNLNEKGVNVFSVINFFRELCDRAAIETENSGGDFEKEAETALDSYFNARPPLDFARGLYADIKSAGKRTKGSVYTNMQSALSIFSLSNIAKLTAESDIDLYDIAFGEKPYAIFIGLPFEDKSNHFLASTFISQTAMYLIQLSKTTKGKLKRPVKFIIDEAGNIPPIENFAGYITAGLGIGLSFDLYYQSYSQGEALFGKEEFSIIKENCATQRFILAAGSESAETFADDCGKKTVIQVQRSGTRFDIDRNYTEQVTEVNLITPSDLMMLREGESVALRTIKRSDRLGRAVLAQPVINEYADPPNVFRKIMIFSKAFLNYVKDTGKEKTFFDRYLIDCNHYQRWHGTAFLYRWQYLSEDFPDPDSIVLYGENGICDESRSDIDYTNYVRNPADVLKELKAKSLKD